MMKAWVLNSIGDITLSDVDVPVPGSGEVRIRVEAAGICGSDIPRIYVTGAHRMPLILGHEFSGVVEGLGKNVPPYWMGRRVAVFPKIACGRCRHCESGHPEYCTDYDYIGSRRNGAFAEYVTAPVGNLMELPDGVDFETGAMMEPMAVAANAFRKGISGADGMLSKDKPIAVCGLGAIGLMVVMFLKEAGFENAYVIGNKETQKMRASSLGIPEGRFINSSREDAAGKLMELSNGGVNAYFECVGSNESVTYGIEAAAPGAKLAIVGNPRMDMNFSKEQWWRILRNQLTVQGIWNSSFRQTDSIYREDVPDDWNYVLRKLSDGKICPSSLISHRLNIDKLEEGFSMMRDKSEDYCKVMMVR